MYLVLDALVNAWNEAEKFNRVDTFDGDPSVAHSMKYRGLINIEDTPRDSGTVDYQIYEFSAINSFFNDDDEEVIFASTESTEYYINGYAATGLEEDVDLYFDPYTSEEFLAGDLDGPFFDGNDMPAGHGDYIITAKMRNSWEQHTMTLLLSIVPIFNKWYWNGSDWEQYSASNPIGENFADALFDIAEESATKEGDYLYPLHFKAILEEDYGSGNGWGISDAIADYYGFIETDFLPQNFIDFVFEYQSRQDDGGFDYFPVDDSKFWNIPIDRKEIARIAINLRSFFTYLSRIVTKYKVYTSNQNSRFITSAITDSSLGWSKSNSNNVPKYDDIYPFDTVSYDACGMVGLNGDEFWDEYYDEGTDSQLPYYLVAYTSWRDVFQEYTFPHWMPTGVEATATVYKHIRLIETLPFSISEDLELNGITISAYRFNGFDEGYSENFLYPMTTPVVITEGYYDTTVSGTQQSTSDPGANSYRPYSPEEIQGYERTLQKEKMIFLFMCSRFSNLKFSPASFTLYPPLPSGTYN
jgi:hypothetical protein